MSDVRPTIAELEQILANPNTPDVEITPAGEVVMKGLRHEIQRAINRVSAENGSNTPDFILADYLVSCLAAFDRSVQQRERWYGRNPNDGPCGSKVAQSPWKHCTCGEFKWLENSTQYDMPGSVHYTNKPCIQREGAP